METTNIEYPSNVVIQENLESIAGSFKGILLDAYGVFWGGNAVGALPGCKEIMEKLVQQGKIVGILSNATQLAGKEIEKIKAHGLTEGKHFHFFITSGEVTKQILSSLSFPLATPRKKYFLFGSDHPKYTFHHALFEGSPYELTNNLFEADFIYVSTPHIGGEDQTDPALFREEITQIIDAKLPMLCANPDQYAHEGNPPRAVVRQGTIARMYEEAGGTVIYLGKPAPTMYEAAMKEFGKRDLSEPKDIVMVGDTPETDIRGAKNYGMASALVLTGMMEDRIARFGLKQACGELPPHDFPDIFIERMGCE